VQPNGADLIGEQGAGHVIWSISAALGQLQVQSWIAYFGIGSVRLLRRAGLRDSRSRAVLIAVTAGPLLVLGLFVAAVAGGIHSFSIGGPSGLHDVLGWLVTGVSITALVWEWRALEQLEALLEETEGSTGAAG
jgi:hypothetical protein